MDADLAFAVLVAAGGALAPRRALLESAGDPIAAVAAAAEGAGMLTATQRAVLRQPPHGLAASVARWCEVPGHRIIGWTDPDYPPALRGAASPPLALFVDGDPALLWRPTIAVVGSRGPTPAGLAHAADFARAFAEAGFVVGSGLAAGIDAAAHAAALAVKGATVAVLGTGPDITSARTRTCRRAFPATARSSPNTCPAPARSANTSPAAIACWPRCASAPSWSRRPSSRAR